MSTFTALTTLRDKSKADALGEALERLIPEPTGVGVFEVEDGSGTWEVGGYFIEQPDEIGLDLLAASHDARPFAVSELEDRDWVAQVRRELTPVYAGRFAVFGAHDRDSIPTNLIKMEIEAAMAFGTGHHGTTQGCLLALDKLVTQGLVATNVADIGSGTGVLAMAAASVWSCTTLASDIDPIATETAKANIAANGMKIGFPAIRLLDFEAPKFAARHRLIWCLLTSLRARLKVWHRIWLRTPNPGRY